MTNNFPTVETCKRLPQDMRTEFVMLGDGTISRRLDPDRVHPPAPTAQECVDNLRTTYGGISEVFIFNAINAENMAEYWAQHVIDLRGWNDERVEAKR